MKWWTQFDKWMVSGIFIFLLSLFSVPLFAQSAPFSLPPLRSASELDYPPFALVQPDGTADGFSVDLLKAVSAVIGRQISFTVGPWSEIKGELAEGEYDVLPLVSYSKERDENFDFTVSYLQMTGTVFVRKRDNSIKNIEDLYNKEVLVMRGDTAHEYLVKNKLASKLILTDSFAEAMTLLSSGKHDAVVIQQLVGLQLIKKLGITNLVPVSSHQVKNIKPAGIILKGFEQKFCFAVQEGNTNLLNELNEGLAIIFTNGTYDELYNKWFAPILPQPEIPTGILIRNVLLALVPLLLVLAVVGIVLLKKEVQKKTRHLYKEIEERKKTEQERNKSIQDLENALEQIKTLSGIIPICASCKQIRNDKGYWQQVETYIAEHSEAEFSHGLCEKCIEKLYGREEWFDEIQKPNEQGGFTSERQ